MIRDCGPKEFDVTGIDGGDHVTTIPSRDLNAVVSSVDVVDYTGARLDGKLSDESWVRDATARHDGVIRKVMGRFTTVPFSLCKVYLSEKNVRRMLIRHQARILRMLDIAESNVEVRLSLRVGDMGPQSNVPYAGNLNTIPILGRSRPMKIVYDLRKEAITDIMRTLAPLTRDFIEERSWSANSPMEDCRGTRAIFLLGKDELPQFAATVDGMGPRFLKNGISITISSPQQPFHFIKGL